MGAEEEYALREWVGDGGRRSLNARRWSARQTAFPFSPMEETMLGPGNPRPRGTARTGRAASRVVVRNYSWDHVTLYLARRGRVWRLGEIEGLSDRSLPLPRLALADLDEIHFVARPLTGRSFRLESFIFPSGATAICTIANQAAMS